jgi:Family of unknown function (DUF5333)
MPLTFNAKNLAVLLAALLAGGPALAQVDELPAYAYDMVAQVTMATTADATCDGIKQRPKKVQNYIVNLYGRLAQDGIAVADAAANFQTDLALAEIAKREVDLRARHGVASQGADALCAAIRAEAKDNKALAAMMRIR